MSDTPELVERIVTVYQTYQGKEVLSTDETGILMSYDTDGLASLQYKWHDIQEKATVQGTTASISARKSDSAYLEEFQKVNCCGEWTQKASIYVSSAYLEVDGQVRPVKVYCTDEGMINPTYIDAETGEILSLS